MQCPVCLEICSHHDLVRNLLKEWKKGYDLPTIDEDEILVCYSKVIKWQSCAELDMAAYTHSYHMMYCCAHDLLSVSLFWKINVWETCWSKKLMKTVISTQILVGRKDICVGLDHFLGNQMKNNQWFMKTEVFMEKKTDQLNGTAFIVMKSQILFLPGWF